MWKRIKSTKSWRSMEIWNREAAIKQDAKVKILRVPVVREADAGKSICR